MVTNQSLLLKSLYWAEKEQTVREISEYSGLDRLQIHRAIYCLRRMGYIKVRRISPHWENGDRIPPKIFVSLKNPELAEKTLKKRGVL